MKIRKKMLGVRMLVLPRLLIEVNGKPMQSCDRECLRDLFTKYLDALTEKKNRTTSSR